MFYFIAWTVFLLACALAVPIAAMLEKRRNAPDEAVPIDDAMSNELAEDSDGSLEGQVVMADGSPEEPAFGEGFGGDSFGDDSGFEEFK